MSCYTKTLTVFARYSWKQHTDEISSGISVRKEGDRNKAQTEGKELVWNLISYFCFVSFFTAIN